MIQEELHENAIKNPHTQATKNYSSNLLGFGDIKAYVQ